MVTGMATSTLSFLLFFFFNDTATTEIYTLSLHDALPIRGAIRPGPRIPQPSVPSAAIGLTVTRSPPLGASRATRAPQRSPARFGWYSRRQPFEQEDHKPVTFARDDLGLRSETIRRANLSAIVRQLHGDGPLSRSELVARTGLTRSAIRGHLGELVAGGAVSERRAAPLGTPGRPSPLVCPEPESAVVLALDIAVDSLAAAIIGLGGDVLEHIRVDRPRGHSSLAAIVDDLAMLADTVRSRQGPRLPEVGIGVAVV